MMNEARLAREELAYDLKLLEESMASFANEDEDRHRRKVNAILLPVDVIRLFVTNHSIRPYCTVL